ncbi:phospholipase D-like domain-containing protein [Enterovibrio sp. ZSDZ42]|uniref:Phospholipase D-like domain-containing protein n=1 Tax=Enterovibrio gelatinilyticus TaxID=2899819 RepID=A0ABT5R340_9GAMM|nr:phospholipase D-like domain-containing protein [Enterovibrio sp. ZSDZ42]MDD1793932.1 phospholipase D-like domain-containing protein [Enterovibrio sp. ZSDZ42]
MSLKLVSNIAGSHLEELQKLIDSGGERLLITSPYLASDMTKFLSRLNFKSVSSVELVTTFKPNDPEQLTKPRQLIDFLRYFGSKNPNMKVKVHIDNSLHGKTYVVTNVGKHRAIITSANFTNSGLCINHEWGILTEHSEELDSLIDEVFEAIEFKELTLNQLTKAEMFVDQYRSQKAWEMTLPEADIDILQRVYSSDSDSYKEPLFFLKPIGTREIPVLLEERQDFSAFHQNLHFSKKKPKGVSKGDVVITAGVGCGSLLSYFKVTGSLLHVTEQEIQQEHWKERWPWYMEGQNQSEKFGASWWAHDIKRNDALEEFRKLYPTTPVTMSGNYTLGTLNFGNDKVQITKEFGEFLIHKIRECE